MLNNIYTSYKDFTDNYIEDFNIYVKTSTDYIYKNYLEDLLFNYLEYYECNYLKDNIIPSYDLTSNFEQDPSYNTLRESLSKLENYFIENDSLSIDDLKSINHNIIIEESFESLDFSNYSFLLDTIEMKKDYIDYTGQKKEVHLVLKYDQIEKLYDSFYKIIDHIKDEIKEIEYKNHVIDSISTETKNKIIDKVIYLNELGIIDYLKSNKSSNVSENGIANIISFLIDEKTTSIQPYINSLTNTHSKNNPYKNQNKVDTIRNIVLKHKSL